MPICCQNAFVCSRTAPAHQGAHRTAMLGRREQGRGNAFSLVCSLRSRRFRMRVRSFFLGVRVLTFDQGTEYQGTKSPRYRVTQQDQSQSRSRTNLRTKVQSHAAGPRPRPHSYCKQLIKHHHHDKQLMAPPRRQATQHTTDALLLHSMGSSATPPPRIAATCSRACPIASHRSPCAPRPRRALLTAAHAREEHDPQSAGCTPDWRLATLLLRRQLGTPSRRRW